MRQFSTNRSISSAILPTLESITASNLSTKPASLSYTLLRTSNNNLPLYRTVRSQSVVTEIKRVQGNVVSFRNDLQEAISQQGVNIDKNRYTCNVQTGTVRIKGDHYQLIKSVLKEKF